MTSMSVNAWKGPAKAFGIALAIDLLVFFVIRIF
jgi:hypothetical protein